MVNTTKTHKSHFLAFLVLGATILHACPASTIVRQPESKQDQEENPRRDFLPSWFKDLDTDGDGQITMREWLNGGRELDEFRQYDLNDDGYITAEEVLRFLKRPFELKFKKGRTNYKGTIEELADEVYGKKSYKIFTIKLERGISYQFDHIGKAFQAFLYLEDSEGNLLEENSSRTVGANSRIIFRASQNGTYRLIATSLGGFRTGEFLLSVYSGRILKGLPQWFKDLDTNGEGQVSLQEWLKSGKDLNEFRTYDLNDDGFVTAEEVVRCLKEPFELKVKNGQAHYNGAIEEAATEVHGKKSYKIFTIKLEQGRTYQFDHISKAFQAFLYLEDSEGNLLEQNSSRTIGENSRITFRARKTGPHRLIATSLGGFRTGDFLLSVYSGRFLKNLPAWFKDLDKDGVGQVTLREWVEAGRKREEFRQYDLNDDGFVTAEEVLRLLKKPSELKFKNGLVTYDGAVEEETEEVYGKKSYKILTIKLEQGKTYQFDHMSKAFQAFLYIEDSDGNLLEENSSSNVGANSHITFRPDKSGTYRVIATSQGGFRTGDFALSVRTGR